jgi:osmotically-inducible protein OsmY
MRCRLAGTSLIPINGKCLFDRSFLGLPVPGAGARHTKERKMNDKQLRQNILDELDFEPSVHAAHIGVAVDNGVVTLSGHVTSYLQKIAAEQAVRRVKGVRAIAQEIEVRYGTEKKTSDDEIAKRALDILRWSVVPGDAISLIVQSGMITLNGEVEWQYQRIAAGDAVRKLSGVTGVINNIIIKPRVSVPDVKQKIEAALKRHAEVEANAIRVSVRDGGKVVLEGKVHDWLERDAVENAAWPRAWCRSRIGCRSRERRWRGMRRATDHGTVGVARADCLEARSRKPGGACSIARHPPP